MAMQCIIGPVKGHVLFRLTILSSEQTNTHPVLAASPRGLG